MIRFANSRFRFIVLLLATGLLLWMNPATVHAQQDGSTPTLNFEFTIETVEGDVLVVPVQLDAEAITALMNLAPTAVVMDALTQLSGQKLQTITLTGPMVEESMTTRLHLQPEEPSQGATAAVNVEQVYVDGMERELLVEPPTDFSRLLPVQPTWQGALASAQAGERTDGVDDEAEVGTLGEDPIEQTVSATGVASVTNANVYRRVSPSISAAILGQLPVDTEVFVVGRNSDGEWLQLDDGSWVATYLVENLPDSLPLIVDGETSVDEIVTATVTGDTVILRDGPSQSHNSLGMYGAGAVAAVLSRTNDGEWYELVMPDGVVGWMAAVLLDVTGEVAVQPAVAAIEENVISGVVVDSSGAGVNSVRIAATPLDGEQAMRLEATTAEDGSFLLDAPTESIQEWSVSILDLGCDSRLMNDRCQLFGYFAAVPSAVVELPQAEPIELVYADATSFIAGTVLDTSGSPVGLGMMVSAERRDGAVTYSLTSSSGKFVLPADAGEWDVFTESGPVTSVRVEEGSAPEPIVVEAY